MNTQDYINELKIQLRKLDNDDREDAIAYYFEYLAEAGPEGAAEAMDKLGTPEQLAAGIRADQAMQDFTEYEGPKGATVGKGVQAVWYAGRASIPRTVLAVFVTIIVIIVFFAVMIALFATSVALILSGALGVGGGAWMFSMDWASSFFYGGIGLVAIALGYLLFHFSIWASKHLLLSIATVFNGIRRKREVRYEQQAPAQGEPQTYAGTQMQGGPQTYADPQTQGGPQTYAGPQTQGGPQTYADPQAAPLNPYAPFGDVKDAEAAGQDNSEEPEENGSADDGGKE